MSPSTPQATTMPETTQGEPIRVRVDLAPADHARLRIAAAKAGQSMASFARSVIIDRLDAEDAPAPTTPAKKSKTPR